jgi:hypothetical protein
MMQRRESTKCDASGKNSEPDSPGTQGRHIVCRVCRFKMRGCCFASPTLLYLKYRYLALPVLVNWHFCNFLISFSRPVVVLLQRVRAPAVLEHSLDSTLRAERGRVTSLFSLNTSGLLAHCLRAQPARPLTNDNNNNASPSCAFASSRAVL